MGLIRRSFLVQRVRAGCQLHAALCSNETILDGYLTVGKCHLLTRSLRCSQFVSVAVRACATRRVVKPRATFSRAMRRPRYELGKRPSSRSAPRGTHRAVVKPRRLVCVWWRKNSASFASPVGRKRMRDCGYTPSGQGAAQCWSVGKFTAASAPAVRQMCSYRIGDELARTVAAGLFHPFGFGKLAIRAHRTFARCGAHCSPMPLEGLRTRRRKAWLNHAPCASVAVERIVLARLHRCALV